MLVVWPAIREPGRVVTLSFQLVKYPALPDNCLYPIPATARRSFDPRWMEHCLSRYLFFFALLAFVLRSPLATARPYPGLSGLAASADSAETAATNPAGITRFKQRALEGEIMWFSSESEWESEFSNSGARSDSEDSGDTVVPRIFYIQPINDRISASFTILGAGFSDDFGDWPGRYFIKSYDS